MELFDFGKRSFDGEIIRLDDTPVLSPENDAQRRLFTPIATSTPNNLGTSAAEWTIQWSDNTLRDIAYCTRKEEKLSKQIRDSSYCTRKEEKLSKEIEIIPGNIEINRRNKELIEMIRRNKEIIRGNIEINRRNKNNNGICEKKEKDFMVYIACCAKKIEELSDKMGRCQSEIEYLETRLSGMTYWETRLGRPWMTDLETRLPWMTDLETRLPWMTDPETCLSLMTDLETRLPWMTDLETCLSLMTDLETCLSGMAYPRGSLNKQQTYLNEYLQNKEEKTARNKYLIYLLMFGNIVWSGLLATSERGKISSVLGYLLGNDGAHSYNGNGLPLTTMRKRTCCNEDILVPARPATLPMNVLFRKPTNEEIARIAKKIGREFIPLACFLGFGEAELDQLENDYPYAVPRNTRFLLRWRDTKDTNPTVKKLADAFRELDFDPYIVYNSLETADKLPKEFLLRELTDKEIARILMKTTIMYVSLAILLGFTKAQLDEMRKVFNQVLKIFEMFKMEDAKTSIATTEKVIDVLGELGIIRDIIPDIISSSLG